MSVSVRDTKHTVHWMMQQHKHRTTGWKGMCQSSVRQSYGVPAWANSAIHAWERIPHKYRAHGDPEEAPVGAMLYYDIGTYGHAALAGYHSDKCWSVDYWRRDEIGPAPRDFHRWGGIEFLGWSFWTPWGMPEQTFKHLHHD